jgi:hypothetical protein
MNDSMLEGETYVSLFINNAGVEAVIVDLPPEYMLRAEVFLRNYAEITRWDGRKSGK